MDTVVVAASADAVVSLKFLNAWSMLDRLLLLALLLLVLDSSFFSSFVCCCCCSPPANPSKVFPNIAPLFVVTVIEDVKTS